MRGLVRGATNPWVDLPSICGLLLGLLDIVPARLVICRDSIPAAKLPFEDFPLMILGCNSLGGDGASDLGGGGVGGDGVNDLERGKAGDLAGGWVGRDGVNDLERGRTNGLAGGGAYDMAGGVGNLA